MTTTNHPRLNTLRALQSDNMLSDFPMFQKLRRLPSNLAWRGLDYGTYYEELQSRIAAVGCLQLKHTITELDAGSYMIDVTMAYERVLDGLNQRMVESMGFLARLKTDLARIHNNRGGFLVLWSIGAADIIEGTPLGKIKESDLKLLAAQEFSLVVNDADVDISALVEAMEITIDSLKGAKRLADAKYTLAKDQINTVMSGMDLSSRGTLMGDPTTHGQGGETLTGVFGDRVQKPMPVQELDEELPMAIFNQTDAPASRGLDLEAGAVLMTQWPTKAKEIRPDAAASSPADSGVALVPLEKPEPGKPLIIPFNLNTQHPGPLNTPDYRINKGRSKVILTAQTDPEENGEYRWMGVDAPLVKLEDVPKKAAPEVGESEASADPVVGMSQGLLEEPDELTEEEVVTAPPVEKTIEIHEGFSTTTVISGGTASNGLDLDDPEPPTEELDEDLPAMAGSSEAPAGDLDEDLPMVSIAKATGVQFDEDLPILTAPAGGGLELDDDDILPPPGVVNRTPATQELAKMPAPAQEAPKPVVATPEPPKAAPAPQAAPKPASAPTPDAPKLGSLFRPRALAPGQVAAPTFKLPATAGEAAKEAF